MKLIKSAFALCAVSASLASLSSCAPSLKGDYGDPNQVEILDDRWNDSDARMAAEEMIRSCLSNAWLSSFNNEHKGAKPVVLVGDFENRTDEHIDTKALFEAVRSNLINSGRLRFVDGDKRGDLLKEYQYQGSGAVRKDEVKGPGKQRGADFFLYGAISNMAAKQDGKKRVTYQVEMRLTNIETSEIEWTEIKKITKRFERSGAKF
jgi:uncharacterized protein (TIGR02722 family)